ncbi:hypothetical protein SSBR45G_14470 [Bradyrhizobium sp. SSBR45G]|uniref:hypothetical protein n=1 Tax=unclassified Bradyrhizobium TaxID=2631580 RepID=UPI002342AC64|nr:MULTISPECIES: hypothetical protein [unclassified Bradyrhizobium]GLH76539.1 hypothetical protein SSBR45G_14470 [Bradyrhizobium sp. SSBR45G]GLH84156.1 hypothetical protein SSBR45R_16160 [Bradyrhizobium sp. SSBR45R]
MRRNVLIIGSVAVAGLLVGGWALAQSADHGPGGMHRMAMGMGMHDRMGPGMRGPMGPGMMGMGPGMMGMMGGSATMEERAGIHGLLFNHDRVERTVTNLPDGIRTVTESDDPEVAATIKKHVADMGKRIEQGRDPGLPIESPALHSLFRYKDKIKTTYETTEKGIIVVQTSTDAKTVKALQDHAAEVTDLAQRGMVAAHEAMMKNGGGMMGMRMHGGMAEPQRED